MVPQMFRRPSSRLAIRRVSRWKVGSGIALALTLLVALASLVSGQAASPHQKTPLRVLVVTGGHSHDASFYRLFEAHSDLRAVIEPHPTAFTKNLVRDFDVIVLYDMVQETQVAEAQRLKLKTFAEAGKGLLVVHHALVSYQDWDWYGLELVGGRYLLEARGGLPKSLYQHDFPMTVTPTKKHPITAGLKPFRIVDETYERMQYESGITVLLRTDAKGSNDPVAWISPYKKSRVVAIQLGHDRQAHENLHFRQVFHRAMLWAGGRLTE